MAFVNPIKGNMVVLEASEGATSISTTATIHADGHLSIDGDDIGSAPSEFFGRSSYEYHLVIEAEHVNTLLLALLYELQLDRGSGFSATKDIADKYGIPRQFVSF
jgi:hypothetical protein